MTNLSQNQEEMRQAIQKSAMIWSIITGIIVAALVFWLLGAQGNIVRFGATAFAGIVALTAIFKWRFAANSKSAQCEKCSAAFSISRTDHQETLVSSENKETRDAQEDYSTKITTWTEETFDVVDTYTCAGCDDVKTKEYTTTRKSNEETEIEAAPVKNAPKEKPSAKAKPSTPKPKPSAKAKPSTPKANKGQASGVASSSKSGKPSDENSSKKG